MRSRRYEVLGFLKKKNSLVPLFNELWIFAKRMETWEIFLWRCHTLKVIKHVTTEVYIRYFNQIVLEQEYDNETTNFGIHHETSFF